MRAVTTTGVIDMHKLAIFISIFFSSSFGVIAQSQTNLTVDPSQGRILNSIFQKWRISASSNWNISGELCSGAAIDSTTMDNNGAFNPGIKCDCSSNPCLIVQLKVYALDAVGDIPDELWNLTSLNNLNLAQNYLTGRLSPSIGNLVRMQYLSLGINSLSGELPKELGKLTDLRSLSFSSNNFSGPLPSELGSLTKLTQIYFDSSGLSGPIPSTFANLQDLATVWAFDNDLTGRIPDFIGNWSKLNVLRLQGNSFEGPIPMTLSNLTSLTDLRISDLSNGSSTLDFIKEMKSLTFLVLRNNNMSGSIPSDIGEYQNLTQLDLSFNNFSGRIPNSLFNMSSLSFLFLGNNKLSGTLPSQKSASLKNIDLSYNDLSGTFPSWISEPSMQINLAVNNFTIEGSNRSGYLAPEYAMRGHLTEKADVFGFGVVALEVISGRPNTDSTLEDDYRYLLEWAWQLHEYSHGIDLVDPSLSVFSEDEVKRLIDVALLCTQTSPNLRPSMSRVVAMLSGDIEVTAVTTKPGYLRDWKFSDSTTFLSADASTSNTGSTPFSSSGGTSQLTDPNYTPVNVSSFMLYDIVEEGR